MVVATIADDQEIIDLQQAIIITLVVEITTPLIEEVVEIVAIGIEKEIASLTTKEMKRMTDTPTQMIPNHLIGIIITTLLLILEVDLLLINLSRTGLRQEVVRAAVVCAVVEVVVMLQLLVAAQGPIVGI
jgi:hypothetical protein